MFTGKKLMSEAIVDVRVIRCGICSIAITICTAVAILLPVDTAASEEMTWKQYKGRGYTLCDELLKELNRYKYPNPIEKQNNCALAVIDKYASLLKLPWTTLDASSHEELLFQINRLKVLGPKSYFSGITDKTDQGRVAVAEDDTREQVRQFIASGGTLQLAQIPAPQSLPKSLRQGGQPEFLTVLNIRTPGILVDAKLERCSGITPVSWLSYVWLVNADLKAPDQRPYTEQGGGLQIYNGANLRLYKGKLYILNASSLEVSIHRDDIMPGDWSRDFCRIQFH